MTKLYKTLILIVYLLPIKLSADTFTIQGRVTDEKTGNPLSNANIYFEQSDIGGVSDYSGDFLLSGTDFGTGTLVVSMIGYKTQTKTPKNQEKREKGENEEQIILINIMISGRCCK